VTKLYEGKLVDGLKAEFSQWFTKKGNLSRSALPAFKTQYLVACFREVHGNLYDYSKVEHKGGSLKVTIICREHGEFQQEPSKHRAGNNCKKCSDAARNLSLYDVIKGFLEVHGDRYDYSKVIYRSAKTNITIICPEHGEFQQAPSNHKSGSGCNACGLIATHASKTLCNESILQEFKAVHGGRYDYSKVEYKGAFEKVTIICPQHGEFQRAAREHKRGSGCTQCRTIKGTPLEQDVVVETFREVHGDKYDYSKVEYVKGISKVIIICPEHGEFLQSPAKHKTGRGCFKCITRNKRTSVEAVSKLIDVHGELYDYSKLEYISSRDKVTVICTNHGEFTPTYSNHLKGAGCPRCKGFDLRNEDHIAHFRGIHGYKYDYSKTVYTGHENMMTITCPKHGDFEQKGGAHRHGKGCNKCNGHGLSNHERIAEFISVHGDLYDYSKVEYKNANAKVVAICLAHGEFKVSPANLKRGKGCPRCVGMYKTHEEVLNSFREAHGDKYDYSKVKYKKAHEKVIITCPEHGEFKQSTTLHRIGSGCSECAKAQRVGLYSIDNITEEQSQSPSGVYSMLLTSDKGEQWIKIGITKNLELRRKAIVRESNYKVAVLYYQSMQLIDAWDTEQAAHDLLSEYSDIPCTYFAGQTECFTTEVLDILPELNLLSYEQLENIYEGLDLLIV
jgi:uncharacterized C2H2 Zn-finger protein